MSFGLFKVQISPGFEYTHIGNISNIYRHGEVPDPEPVAHSPAAARIDSSTLCSERGEYWTPQLCYPCRSLVTILRNWVNRDTENWELKGLQGVVTLNHEDENG